MATKKTTPNETHKIGYEIHLDKGPIPSPKKIQIWQDQTKFKQNPAHEPFKYHADALIGLSTEWLQNWSKNVEANHFDWMVLEPHFDMYFRSHERILALRDQLPPYDKNLLHDFEKTLSETVRHTFSRSQVDLTDLFPIIEAVDFLEAKGHAPLLFNLSAQFSPEFTQKLQVLYCLLWNLRSLVAVDHNAHIQDASHEALRVDSISDYLPKSDYIVNDAILYYHMKKLTLPFISGRTSDVRIEKLLVQPLMKSFHQYSHNASYLIDHLPESFLKSLNPIDLEQALYLVQMDWLLGSEAGLLYKIREELYGLQSGYDKTFWTDWSSAPLKRAMQLKVCCEISPHLLKHDAA